MLAGISARFCQRNLYTCGTSDITLDQVREAFRAWAQANPGKLGGSAIDGLAEAAAARWPCPDR